jgi:hypothetical protein
MTSSKLHALCIKPHKIVPLTYGICGRRYNPKPKTGKIMTINKLFLIFIAFVVVGCSSSPYTYHEKPISLKKGQSSYYLKDITVNLTLGHGAISGDNTFANKEEMAKQFESALNMALKEKGILATSSSNADADIEVIIDYKRNFNYGGKALNKPHLSHQVNIYKGSKKLVSFNASKYTTKYSYFKDLAVNIEISAFNWGADDELQDIEFISKTIVDDLSKVGS